MNRKDAKDRLWAPWRLPYIQRNSQKDATCVFCRAKRSRLDKARHILKRGEFCFAILNLYPYNNGHLMIVPYRHVADLDLLTHQEQKEMFQMTIEMQRVLKQTLAPHGFNIGINLGDVAGAGIKQHLHLHVVPRWKGDTNFMPVVGATKVISQSLDALYESLSHAIARGIRRARR